MKYIKVLLFVLFLSLSFTFKVRAEQFVTTQKIPGVYYKKVAKSGKGHYAAAAIIEGKNFQRHVYCLDPFIKMGEGKEYKEHLVGNGNLINISFDTWKKISATAYFGYGYFHHEDPIWYAVTQVAIWRLVDPTTDSYFTSELNGQRTNIYDNKLNELNNMVNEYLNLPLNIEKTLTDERPQKIFKTFENENVYIDGLSEENGYAYLNDRFKGTKHYRTTIGMDNNAILYTLSGYQTLVTVIDLPLTQRNIYLTNAKGSIRAKLNIENNIYSNCKSESKNKYNIYDENWNLVKVFEFNFDEEIISDLEYGDYYVKQIESTCDIIKDDTPYKIHVKDKINDLNILSKKKTLNIQINKRYCNDDVCEDEKDALFSIGDDNYSKNLLTNDLGYVETNIGMGNYILHQIKGKENYSYIDDYQINSSNYPNNIARLELYNRVKKYNLNIYIKDQFDSPIRDSKVCLYDAQDNLIRWDLSSDLGLVKFNNINIGNYYIKQEKVDKKYAISTIKNNIDLKSNNDIVIINKLNEENIAKKSTVEEKEEQDIAPVIQEVVKKQDNIINSENKEEDNINNIKTNYIYDTYVNDIDYIIVSIAILSLIILVLKLYEKYYC